MPSYFIELYEIDPDIDVLLAVNVEFIHLLCLCGMITLCEIDWLIDGLNY